MIWTQYGQESSRWKVKDAPSTLNETSKDSSYASGHSETDENMSNDSENFVFTWNESKQAFDSNFQKDSKAKQVSPASSSKLEKSCSPVEECKGGKVGKKRFKNSYWFEIMAVSNITESEPSLSLREQKKLKTYENLFKKLEARDQKTKAKKAKPQVARTGKKRGRKPKKKVQKANLPKPEPILPSEVQIELIEGGHSSPFWALDERNPDLNSNYGQFMKEPADSYIQGIMKETREAKTVDAREVQIGKDLSAQSQSSLKTEFVQNLLAQTKKRQAKMNYKQQESNSTNDFDSTSSFKKESGNSNQEETVHFHMSSDCLNSRMKNPSSLHLSRKMPTISRS